MIKFRMKALTHTECITVNHTTNICAPSRKTKGGNMNGWTLHMEGDVGEKGRGLTSVLRVNCAEGVFAHF